MSIKLVILQTIVVEDNVFTVVKISIGAAKKYSLQEIFSFRFI